MNLLQIHYKNPAELRPHPRNARIHSDRQIDQIAPGKTGKFHIVRLGSGGWRRLRTRAPLLDGDDFTPQPAAKAIYDRLYAEYITLHEYFGRGGSDVMKRMKALKADVLAGNA